MSKMVWFSFLLCHLFLFHGTLSSNIGKVGLGTEIPVTIVAPTNGTVRYTSLPATTTTQLPATGEIQVGNHENPEGPLSPRDSLEKPRPKKRGILDSLYQPGNFDETGYDTNEDAGPDASFSTSKSDFEEKPFYKYGDAAFVVDDGYFENEGRTKRTTDEDEMYNKQPEREIELTMDEIVDLLGYLESRYDEEEREKPLPYPDNNIESIQADMRDEARNRDPHRYDRMIASYLQRVKGVNIGRVRRSSGHGRQRPYTPRYRRLIL